MVENLSLKERRAVEGLKSLSRNWPTTLWLFSANGSLSVMRYGADKKPATLPNGGMDPDYAVATINIRSDGGDW